MPAFGRWPTTPGRAGWSRSGGVGVGCGYVWGTIAFSIPLMMLSKWSSSAGSGIGAMCTEDSNHDIGDRLETV